MDEVRKAILERNTLLMMKQHAPDLLEKGAAVPVGTVSNGRKKMPDGSWRPVTNPRTKKEAPVPGNRQGAKKPDAKKKPSAAPAEKPQIATHEIAKLKKVKQLHAAGKHSEAHDMTEEMSDEAKNVIPPNVWSEMMDGKAASEKDDEFRSFENENDIQKYFDTYDDEVAKLSDDQIDALDGYRINNRVNHALRGGRAKIEARLKEYENIPKDETTE